MPSKPRKQARRGSTLVMVALMLVAFAGVGAIAADIGRFYVITGELQTSADAAALMGAFRLQMSSAVSPESDVDNFVVNFVSAGNNRAEGATLPITAEDVKMVFYTPETRNGQTVTPPSFVYNPTAPTRPNAVSVTLRKSPRGVFAQIIGRTGAIALQREAVAWIGNLSLQCIRPFAFPYSAFYRRVNGIPVTTALANPIPSVTPTAMAAFQGSSDQNRTFIVLGPESYTQVMNNPDPVLGPLPNDSSWRGYNPPSNQQGNANSGQTTFENFMTSCSGVAVNSDAGEGNTVPTNGNGMAQCGAYNISACWASNVVNAPTTGNGGNTRPANPVCPYMVANDAGCYASSSAQTPGVFIDMAWSDIVGNGQSVDFRYVGEFEIKCFFKLTTDTCASIPYPRKTGYPVGTIVGIAAGLKSRVLNPTEDIVSNSPSNVQRLFLVK